ncbi:MAG TPA: MarR family transcriptional regulator [Kiritimatiellia bacterium]|nr:MarR family transcriptional regulator [Kiritimatiellia bacterium]
MSNRNSEQVRDRLVRLAGTISQDLGLGRITGQILVYLYLRPAACSLDAIEADLGLSKAAVSIAARQLESIGLLKRIRKKGDRKSYYQTAENLGSALQKGLFGLMSRKLEIANGEFQQAIQELEAEKADADAIFLEKRIKRAMVLGKRMDKIISSPLIKLLGR